MTKKRSDSKAKIAIQASLFSEELKRELEEPLSLVRSRESEMRIGINLTTDVPVPPNFPSIILPLRWEILEEEAGKKNIPIKPLITPVRDALDQVEVELRRMKETGMGRLFVISGVTGSGKTTFLNSLRLFLDDINIYNIGNMKAIDSREIVESALASLQREYGKTSVVVLEGRETPGSLKNDEIDILLTSLNMDFRKGYGRTTLFVIPTTSSSVAQSISNRASDIGDMSSNEHPFYVFSGPTRKDYISITNETLRALNDSRTLLEYGITDEIANGIAESAASIGSFMGNCYAEIEKYRKSLSNFVATSRRKRIHLWVIFCSLEEDARRNDDIIRSFTIGDNQQIQVKRLLIGDSKEVRFWEVRQEIFARAAQYLDLRIMYLPLRTANAIVTAYAHKEFISHLKSIHIEEDGEPILKREAVRVNAQESLGSTALGAFLKNKGFIDRDPSKRGKPSPHQIALFKKIVEYAAKDDKAINAMIAAALRDWNGNPDEIIATEVSINEPGSLKSDIAVVTPTDIYCLEMKWHSTLLQNSNVTRETVGRVQEFAQELPELKKVLGDLD